MKRQTFILLQNRTYRHAVNIFLMGIENKVYKKEIVFTTEHKVSEKERNRNARLVPAEFNTADKTLVDAIYRDTGYGKTFVNIDDPEGKKRLESFDISPLDSKKAALKNLFAAANMDYDGNKSASVLEEEYRIFITAKAGAPLKVSPPAPIEHEVVDVDQVIKDSVAAAHKLYEEKYKEPIPSEFANDKAFLAALADPKWDAKAYIAEHSTVVGGDDLPPDAASLGEIYFRLFGKKVANIKKNDAAWITAQIKEKKSEQE